MNNDKMKAIVYREYGGPEVLKLEELEKPSPKDDEVLVKIFATNVNFGDLFIRKFNEITPKKFNMPFIFWLPTKILLGINKPKINIVGSEYSGVIESIGKDVNNFKVGEEVFGYRSMKMGANAEFISVPAKGLIINKPKNVTFDEAATFPYGALTALNLLRKAEIKPGQKILINGASGSIGSHSVQLAKHYGAEVTGVCGTERMKFVKSIGANKVIDYTKEDFTKNGETYDVIFDILGRTKFKYCKNSLTENGKYLLASFKMKQLTQMIWTKIFSSKKVICAMSSENYDDLVAVKSLIERGVFKAIIDKTFPLEETSKAHEYIESGKKKAQIVITVEH